MIAWWNTRCPVAVVVVSVVVDRSMLFLGHTNKYIHTYFTCPFVCLSVTYNNNIIQ